MTDKTPDPSSPFTEEDPDMFLEEEEGEEGLFPTLTLTMTHVDGTVMEITTASPLEATEFAKANITAGADVQLVVTYEGIAAEEALEDLVEDEVADLSDIHGA